MRRSTIIWVMLAFVIGGGLFVIKHQVQEAEDRLAALNEQILRGQEAVHVLRAEWTYLNQPARLQDLAARHLQMEPTKTTQMRGWDALPDIAVTQVKLDGGDAAPAAPLLKAPSANTRVPPSAAPNLPNLPSMPSVPTLPATLISAGPVQ